MLDMSGCNHPHKRIVSQSHLEISLTGAARPAIYRPGGYLCVREVVNLAAGRWFQVTDHEADKDCVLLGR